MFKKVKENKKGFTLAELLIVVAIIAVLVAISIPIFTSQLEKAREATDEANIRSIYAQLSADVLTENITTDATKNKASCPAAATYTVSKADDGKVTGTAEYVMTQKTDGLASGSSITVGGVELSSAQFTIGTCTITITDDGKAPTITFKK